MDEWDVGCNGNGAGAAIEAAIAYFLPVILYFFLPGFFDASSLIHCHCKRWRHYCFMLRVIEKQD